MDIKVTRSQTNPSRQFLKRLKWKDNRRCVVQMSRDTKIRRPHRWRARTTCWISTDQGRSGCSDACLFTTLCGCCAVDDNGGASLQSTHWSKSNSVPELSAHKRMPLPQSGLHMSVHTLIDAVKADEKKCRRESGFWLLRTGWTGGVTKLGQGCNGQSVAKPHHWPSGYMQDKSLYVAGESHSLTQNVCQINDATKGWERLKIENHSTSVYTKCVGPLEHQRFAAVTTTEIRTKEVGTKNA